MVTMKVLPLSIGIHIHGFFRILNRAKYFQMKQILILLFLGMGGVLWAQAPYNPDSDGDSLIGSADLLNLLPLYGEGFYVDTDPVIDTLDWTGAVDDTLQLSAEADIVFVNGGGWTDEELADVCSGARRYYNISEIDQVFKRYIFVVQPSLDPSYILQCANDNSVEWLSGGGDDEWPRMFFLYYINGTWIRR